MSEPKRIVWVLGCRAGSNLTVRYLAACGATLPVASPPPPSEWNRDWGEDAALWALSSRLFGNEPKLHVQRQWRPPAGDSGWEALPELLDYFRAHATAPLTVFKFGGLPWVWPEIRDALPDHEHTLVCCERDVERRIASLCRLHPDTPRAEVVEFVGRHFGAMVSLATRFTAEGRHVVWKPHSQEGLWGAALTLGLTPTPEAEALWRHT